MEYFNSQLILASPVLQDTKEEFWDYRGPGGGPYQNGIRGNSILAGYSYSFCPLRVIWAQTGSDMVIPTPS